MLGMLPQSRLSSSEVAFRCISYYIVSIECFLVTYSIVSQVTSEHSTRNTHVSSLKVLYLHLMISLNVIRNPRVGLSIIFQTSTQLYVNLEK